MAVVAPQRPLPPPSSRAPAPPLRRGAPAPPLRLVPRPSRGVRYVVVCGVVLALGVFGVVTINALAAELAFEARALEQEVDALAVRHDELTAEVASLESPARVRRFAVDELGMVPAQKPAYLLLSGTDDPTRAAQEVAR